ncbi:pyridoxal phosphate-dependent aminotransferase [Clostridium sp. MSJ-4]|uniref:Pyridoxal phosphate-dependent aminotransferase n=1 Tax=Clostridium simiarum TaxID=2841506 RepID=A0ABS6EVW9_9CLOT|nr:MalY/PatB family protein [Clostridium simiarum]MBU5590368.1 pyridoxal phosphate-dependent aminotransferase [Clostridium simiarum]
MAYNFDEIIHRRGTTCVKWDEGIIDLGEEFLPMWVADMDFPCPVEVHKAIKKRAEHPIFGYTYANEEVYRLIIDRLKNKYGWHVEKDWIVFLPGVVDGIATSINSFTKENEGIIIQQPVYHPFALVPEAYHRKVLVNNLKESECGYDMDLEDIKNIIKRENPKMLILCNPHNPLGKVWSKSELEKLGEICIENNILVVSDEIHSDIIYKGFKHTPFASISKEFEANSITLMAPSKTFNVAGLSQAFAVIPNKELRDSFVRARIGYNWGNVFGITSLEACYKYGDKYIEELLCYLEKNIDFVEKYLKEKLPIVKMKRPEGTYLLWLDMRDLNMPQEELDRFLKEKVKVKFNSGNIFGKLGEGFQRMNIACPRSYIEECMQRLEKAINSL